MKSIVASTTERLVGLPPERMASVLLGDVRCGEVASLYDDETHQSNFGPVTVTRTQLLDVVYDERLSDGSSELDRGHALSDALK